MFARSYLQNLRKEDAIKMMSLYNKVLIMKYICPLTLYGTYSDFYWRDSQISDQSTVSPVSHYNMSLLLPMRCLSTYWNPQSVHEKTDNIRVLPTLQESTFRTVIQEVSRSVLYFCFTFKID
jgi:hypothetical protein